jgi:hypothetical protein
MRKFLTSGRRRYTLLLLLVGAGSLAVMGNSCAPAPTKPPPPPPTTSPPHNNVYYTEVHVAPGSVSGHYEFNTACVLENGTTSTHHDALDHNSGTETIKTYSWPEPDPVDCTATETAGPPGTTPSYWLSGTALAPFGSPTVYVPITEPTSTPQTCHETIIGTYNGDPPLDFWDCIFTVENT